MKQLTPIKAIRAKCINCSGGALKEVRLCPCDDCILYPLRLGIGSRAVLKTIRAYCLWCSKSQRDEIKLCPSVGCPLWEYRFGKRPKKAPLLPEILTTEWVLETTGDNKGKDMGSMLNHEKSLSQCEIRGYIHALDKRKEHVCSKGVRE